MIDLKGIIDTDTFIDILIPQRDREVLEHTVIHLDEPTKLSYKQAVLLVKYRFKSNYRTVGTGGPIVDSFIILINQNNSIFLRKVTLASTDTKYHNTSLRKPTREKLQKYFAAFGLKYWGISCY
jgi:hypothetical protein